MHAKELARRLEASRVSVYALHPGIVNTELMRNLRDRWWYNGCSEALAG